MQGAYDRKVDAAVKLAELVSDQAHGTWVDPRDGRRLFRDLAAEWQVAQVHADTTRLRVDSNFATTCCPTSVTGRSV